MSGSIILAAKYVVLAMDTFNSYYELHHDETIEAISVEFLEAAIRRRAEWQRRQTPPR